MESGKVIGRMMIERWGIKRLHVAAQMAQHRQHRPHHWSFLIWVFPDMTIYTLLY